MRDLVVSNIENIWPINDIVMNVRVIGSTINFGVHLHTSPKIKKQEELHCRFQYAGNYGTG